jgi:hypothetical protein
MKPVDGVSQTKMDIEHVTVIQIPTINCLFHVVNTPKSCELRNPHGGSTGPTHDYFTANLFQPHCKAIIESP